MVQVFLGYRPVMAHVLFKAPPGESQIVEELCPEIEEWCKNNLKGTVTPVYAKVTKPNDDKEYRRWEFEFSNEDDIPMFKLFHIGG
jgi:hypothetical protein